MYKYQPLKCTGSYLIKNIIMYKLDMTKDQFNYFNSKIKLSSILINWVNAVIQIIKLYNV